MSFSFACNFLRESLFFACTDSEKHQQRSQFMGCTREIEIEGGSEGDRVKRSRAKHQRKWILFSRQFLDFTHKVRKYKFWFGLYFGRCSWFVNPQTSSMRIFLVYKCVLWFVMFRNVCFLWIEKKNEKKKIKRRLSFYLNRVEKRRKISNIL